MIRPAPPPVESIAINAVLVAVRQAADAICDRWSFEILLAAFEGATRFGDFAERTTMASRLVASRLRALEELGVLGSGAYSANPPRREYRLTRMGDGLAEVIRQMLRWEHRWAAPDHTRARLSSSPLAGAEQAVLRCLHCGAQATARDITLHLDDAQALPLPDKKAVHRRSTFAAPNRVGDGRPLGESLDIFGDKWGIEILICSFFRVRRFGDFRACTGISANILSDRLARLQILGILTPSRDEATPQGYWLTEKGMELYGVTVAVQEWADAWLPKRTRSPVTLIHTACAKPFAIAGRDALAFPRTGSRRLGSGSSTGFRR